MDTREAAQHVFTLTAEEARDRARHFRTTQPKSCMPARPRATFKALRLARPSRLPAPETDTFDERLKSMILSQAVVPRVDPQCH
jgi:hypothetical protein